MEHNPPFTPNNLEFGSRKTTPIVTGQNGRVLNYMREHGSVSSIEATVVLDILDPRRRIKDLRDKGYLIYRKWCVEKTPCGRSHRVGRYFLVEEAKL